MRTRALALILLACVESLDARVTKIVVAGAGSIGTTKR